ncbi:hypothetical protein UY3_15588 [Chelonia mydas]|uniref:Uncharacterized protein n=1 Tax=Chelonia mydas TaxID=8469 RepID=M7AWA9_CHEMY|nr:hypothetical protein UY3_15588 [Chelonia mydas]
MPGQKGTLAAAERAAKSLLRCSVGVEGEALKPQSAAADKTHRGARAAVQTKPVMCCCGLGLVSEGEEVNPSAITFLMLLPPLQNSLSAPK